MDATLLSRGLNPDQYTYQPAKPRPDNPGRRAPQRPTPDQPDNLNGTPESVLVDVADTFPGVWARFTGRTLAGGPVTVSGAVVAGPELLSTDGSLYLAVRVRDYRNNPDVVVLTEPHATAEVRDDPDDHEARGRWAVNPVFQSDELPLF